MNPVPDASPNVRHAPPAGLAQALSQLDWGPRDLARAVNSWLTARGRSQDRINITAAYPWVRENYCPHGSIPTVVATVISEQLGRDVSAADLWPDNPRARRAVHQVADLSAAASFDDVARALRQLAGGARPRPITGTQLVSAVAAGVEHPRPPIVGRSQDRVRHAQAALIADHVGALRRLDDRQGGGALSLRYVKNELASVLDLLTAAGYDPDVGQELMVAVADLAQLTGWMQFDAGETAMSRSYLLLAIRAAQLAGDHNRVVNYGGLLSYAVAQAGQGAVALRIVETLAGSPTSSKLLRARTAGRIATASASIGDLAGFRAAADNAQMLLAQAPKDETASYLYYLNPDQLAAEAGHGLVKLAASGKTARSIILKDAISLLEPLSLIGDSPDSQRSALLHGCELAKAHILRRNLEAAVEVTRIALKRLDVVQSGRCAGLLQDLRKAFAQRRQAQVVADFLPELDQALSHF